MDSAPAVACSEAWSLDPAWRLQWFSRWPHPTFQASAGCTSKTSSRLASSSSTRDHTSAAIATATTLQECSCATCSRAVPSTAGSCPISSAADGSGGYWSWHRRPGCDRCLRCDHHPQGSGMQQALTSEWRSWRVRRARSKASPGARMVVLQTWQIKLDALYGMQELLCESTACSWTRSRGQHQVAPSSYHSKPRGSVGGIPADVQHPWQYTFAALGRSTRRSGAARSISAPPRPCPVESLRATTAIPTAFSMQTRRGGTGGGRSCSSRSTTGPSPPQRQVQVPAPFNEGHAQLAPSSRTWSQRTAQLSARGSPPWKCLSYGPGRRQRPILTESGDHGQQSDVERLPHKAIELHDAHGWRVQLRHPVCLQILSDMECSSGPVLCMY